MKEDNCSQNPGSHISERKLVKVEFVITTCPELRPFLEMAVLLLEGVYELHQGQLNSLKLVGVQLTNKTYFYCEHLQILWGQVPQVPPWFRRICAYELHNCNTNYHCP